MDRDSLYRKPKSPVLPFEFDEHVVRVFDDMIHRSIPFYAEIIGRQVQLIERFYQPGTVIYDLGCSNGNLVVSLLETMAAPPFRVVAVDNSQPMLEALRMRLVDLTMNNEVVLRCEDIGQTRIEDASVVILNFTLQFIPPEARDEVLAHIYQGLRPGGILLFCEKITHDNDVMADLQQTLYHGFKRENGYSDLEISQKREALEQVLIPETMQQHLHRLNRVGFEVMDVWQKWFNFAALIAIK